VIKTLSYLIVCLIDRGESAPVACAGGMVRFTKQTGMMTVTAARPERHSFQRLA
jgi:hypothetical protein